MLPPACFTKPAICNKTSNKPPNSRNEHAPPFAYSTTTSQPAQLKRRKPYHAPISQHRERNEPRRNKENLSESLSISPSIHKRRIPSPNKTNANIRSSN